MRSRFVPAWLLVLTVAGAWLWAQAPPDPLDLAAVPYLEIVREGCLYEDTICIPWENEGRLCWFSQSGLCWEVLATSSDENCGEWTGWVEASATVVLRSRECSKGRFQWEPWPYSLVKSQGISMLTTRVIEGIRQAKRLLGDGLFWLEVPLPPGVECGEWGPWIEVRPGLQIRAKSCTDEYGSLFFRWEAQR